MGRGSRSDRRGGAQLLRVRLPFFGPFLVSDIAGLDVGRASMEIMEEAFGERMAVPPSVAERVEQGRPGLKGFFAHGGPDAERLRRSRHRAHARLVRLRTGLANENGG